MKKSILELIRKIKFNYFPSIFKKAILKKALNSSRLNSSSEFLGEAKVSSGKIVS